MDHPGATGGLQNIYRYAKVLSRGQRVEFLLLITVGFLGSVAESFGIAMFLPLLGGLSGNGASGNLERIVLELFAAVGLPVSLLNVLLAVLGFFLIKGALKFGEGNLRGRLLARSLRSLRRDLVRSYGNLEYAVFARASRGELGGLFTGEIAQTQHAFTLFCHFLSAAASFFAFSAFALLTNFSMTAFGIGCGAAASLLLRRISARTNANSRRASEGALQLNALMMQALGSFKYLKASDDFGAFTQLIEEGTTRQAALQRRGGFYDGLLGGLQQPISAGILVALVLWNHNLHGYPIAATLVVLIVIYKIMNALMTTQNHWQLFSAVRGSLDAVLRSTAHFASHREARVGIVPGTEPATAFAGWHFKGVGLELGARPILQNCSFRVPERGLIGIVGSSGAGKSTLFDMLCGLVPPSKGELLDGAGQPREFADLRNFRGRLGLVTQDLMLFEGSVLFNVTLRKQGWGELSAEEQRRVRRAVALSASQTIIDRLPSGLETPVGDGHAQLSGGERQRLCLARAIYRQPAILLLDEVTSALDADCESRVMRSLRELAAQIPVLLITHKPDLLADAREIWVMRQGQVVEQGDFNTLIRRPGGYLESWVSASRGESGAGAPRVLVRGRPDYYCILQLGADGCQIDICDLSASGIGLMPNARASTLKPGQQVKATICLGELRFAVVLRLVHVSPRKIGAEFAELSAAARTSLGNHLQIAA